MQNYIKPSGLNCTSPAKQTLAQTILTTMHAQSQKSILTHTIITKTNGFHPIPTTRAMAATVDLLAFPIEVIAAAVDFIVFPIEALAMAVDLLAFPVEALAAAVDLSAFPVEVLAATADLLAFPVETLVMTV